MNLLKESFIGQFLSVYDETDTNGQFHVCRFLCQDSEHALFQAISTRGYCDGFYCIPKDYVFRIDTGDEYTKRIEKLFRLQKQEERTFCPIENSTLFVALLSYAKKEKLVSSLFLEDDEIITGIITDVNLEEELIQVEKMMEDGKSNGFSCIDINTIEKIICDSGWERCIKMLSETSCQ